MSKRRIEKFIAGTEPTKPDDWYVSCNGKAYLHPPAEYASWIAAAGYEESPSSCDGVTTSSSTLQILVPLDGDTFVRDELVTSEMQRIAFIASDIPTYVGTSVHVYIWHLNGQRIESRDPVTLWSPKPGRYELTLDGATGTVHFIVK